MSMLLAIDPGTTESGWVKLADDDTILDFGKSLNDEVLGLVRHWRGDLVIEMIASYGMAVGKEVFQTCVWIGRFTQAFIYDDEVKYITRNEVKNHVCGSSKANDSNIRTALIDLFGPPGKKSEPGPTYGFSKDMWAALGVAVTARNLGPLRKATA